MRIALALLIVVLFFAVYNSPMLLYPFIPALRPCSSPEEVSLEGRTLFVADLHIRSLEKPDPLFREIGGFARKDGIGNVVVVGDFFERPKVFYTLSGEGERFGAMRKALGLGGERLFWITGSPFHDPQELENGWHENLTVLGRCAVFQLNGSRIIAYHGDHMSRLGSLGFALSYATGSLFLERTWKALANVDRDAMVITGHTHVSGVNEKARVANPGGWKRIRFFNPPLGRGIVVDEEKTELVNLLT